MGLFKQMKQMREVVAEAPAMIAGAQQLQQTYLQQAALQQATLQQAQPAAAGSRPATLTTDPGDASEEIAGVSLERYAAIARDLADRGGDQALAPSVAAEHGVDRAAWDAAVAGWNQRIATDPTIAQRFNLLWRGA